MGNECCVLNEYFLFSFCDFLMIFHKFFYEIYVHAVIKKTVEF